MERLPIVGAGVVVNCRAAVDDHCRIEGFSRFGVNVGMAESSVWGCGAGGRLNLFWIMASRVMPG